MRPYNLNSVGGGILTWSLGVVSHRLQGTRLSACAVKTCLSINCVHTLPSCPAVNTHKAVKDSVASWGLGHIPTGTIWEDSWVPSSQGGHVDLSFLVLDTQGTTVCGVPACLPGSCCQATKPPIRSALKQSRGVTWY